MEGGEGEKNSLQGKEEGGETAGGCFSLDMVGGKGVLPAVLSPASDGVAGLRGLGTPPEVGFDAGVGGVMLWGMLERGGGAHAMGDAGAGRGGYAMGDAGVGSWGPQRAVPTDPTAPSNWEQPAILQKSTEPLSVPTRLMPSGELGHAGPLGSPPQNPSALE